MVTQAQLQTRIQADATLFDGDETVTITLKRSPANSSDTVADCLRRAVQRHERSYSGAQLVGNETVWHIPVSNFLAAFAGEEMREGDIITEGTRQWVVITSALQTLEARWRCVCNDVDER